MNAYKLVHKELNKDQAYRFLKFMVSTVERSLHANSSTLNPQALLKHLITCDAFIQDIFRKYVQYCVSKEGRGNPFISFPLTDSQESYLIANKIKPYLKQAETLLNAQPYYSNQPVNKPIF